MLVEPNPPPCVLPLFTSVVSVQEDPFQISVVVPYPGSPVVTIAFEFDVPQLTLTPFAVFKSLTSVQLDPFQDSAITG